MHPFENRPEDGALLLRQTHFPAQTPGVAVSLPGIQLPGINHVLPLHHQKMACKFVPPDCAGGFFEKLTDLFP